MNVEFNHAKSGKSYTVPAYFAADGDAGKTSAVSGDKWRVHFAPDAVGEWTYRVSFYDYLFVSVSQRDTPNDHVETVDPHGATGSFTIAASDKTGRDLRSKGRLEVGRDRYLRFTETGEIFFELGPDAPENLLAYADFDGTFHNDGHSIHQADTVVKDEGVKTWAPHLKDWKESAPTWGKGRGKALIGAVNYLASKGLNAFLFLTLNIEGDYCPAEPGQTYIVYIKDGDEISLRLAKGTYDLRWYNPRQGAVESIRARPKGEHSLGMPPEADGKDWVALLTRN